MNIKWAKWKRVLLTRSIAMVPTIIVALIATNDLDMMNNWLNVLQSVQLPFALLPILHFTSSETIMREFNCCVDIIALNIMDSYRKKTIHVNHFTFKPFITSEVLEEYTLHT
jgi:Mn2+/Fe2+ NRAMP family transporter